MSFCTVLHGVLNNLRAKVQKNIGMAKFFDYFAPKAYLLIRAIFLLKLHNFAQKFAQKIMELQELIKQEGIKVGMCEKFQELWGNPNLETLCEYFHRGQDFCIEKDFPSLDIIEPYADDVTKYGIYAKDGIAKSQLHVVALGNSNVEIDVTSVTDVTVRHNATVRISLHGKCLCYVSARDNCKVIIEHKDPQSRLCMSYWSGEIQNKELFDKITNK